VAEKRDPTQGSANVAEYSVSELSQAIKRTLEDGFGYVRLRGEISGYRGPHASGHCYFGIKDERAKLDAVIWRGVFSKLKIRPEEGMEVIAHGKITSYPNASKYQIVVEALEPAGVGALMALLEERKRKFAAEGLFDDARKKPIPFLPRVIGIVTSPTGAVIRDMLAGFTERFPAHVVVWPVRVQGETSAAEVAAGIRGFNAAASGPLDAQSAVPRPDLIIVARGGGSLEDLWGFNEEVVVRAAAESEIPLISAVGHETDWTLIDLVADARAPTPTKAAEWSVPKYSDLIEQLDGFGLRLRGATRKRHELARSQLTAAARGLPRLQDILTLPRQRFDAVDQRLPRALIANTAAHEKRLTRATSRMDPRLLVARIRQHRDAVGGFGVRLSRASDTGLVMKRRRLENASKLLATLSYQSVLARGFAIVRDDAGAMVRSADVLDAGAGVELQFGDGRRSATITDGAGSVATGDGDAAPPQRTKPKTEPQQSKSRSDGQAARAPQRSGVKERSAREARATRNKQGSLF